MPTSDTRHAARLHLHNSGTYLVHMQELIPSHIAAERLGVSRSTVQNMCKDGRLTPAARVAGPRGGFLLDSEQIDELIATRAGLTVEAYRAALKMTAEAQR